MLYTGKGDGGTTKTFGCDQQRISSLLFALARLVNHQSGVNEESPSYR